MIKSAIDFGIKIFLCLLTCFYILTCGIEEYYYLPQVPENRIKTQSVVSAIVNLPGIPSAHYYATGYRIYYRIYLSGGNYTTVDVDDMQGINPSLASDYRAFSSLRDPTNTSSIPTISSFSNQRYYELNYYIDTSGGTFEFLFPTDGTIPYVNNIQTYLLRNSECVPSAPNHEPFFRNTEGLNESADPNSRKNMDVASVSSGQVDRHAYVAMYVVAVGQNPQNFSNIFSKPTFIGVLKLPNNY